MEREHQFHAEKSKPEKIETFWVNSDMLETFCNAVIYSLIVWTETCSCNLHGKCFKWVVVVEICLRFYYSMSRITRR